jgi:hypothetical protein
MKLHEIVSSAEVAKPPIPKRLSLIRKPTPNIFLDFMRQLENERKRKK